MTTATTATGTFDPETHTYTMDGSPCGVKIEEPKQERDER